jgi:hypothetical protein
MAKSASDFLAYASERLDFDRETGQFFWKVSVNSRAPAGRAAGRLGNRGYIDIGIGREKVAAHRLAFLFAHGRWPVGDVDHINGRRTDNRPENLREASRSQNMGNTPVYRNNRSGKKGVSFEGRRQKWRASIQGRFLGHFDTIEGAAAAYAEAARTVFGSYARLK